MTKRQPLKRQQTPQSKVVGVSRSNLPLNKQKSTNLIQQNSNKMVDHQQQQQKPVIRPRKAQQQQQLVQSIKNTTEEIVPVQIAQKEEEIVMAMKAEDQMEEKEQVIEEPGLEEGNIVQLDESILKENESDIKKPEYEKVGKYIGDIWIFYSFRQIMNNRRTTRCFFLTMKSWEMKMK